MTETGFLAGVPCRMIESFELRLEVPNRGPFDPVRVVIDAELHVAGRLGALMWRITDAEEGAQLADLLDTLVRWVEVARVQ